MRPSGPDGGGGGAGRGGAGGGASSGGAGARGRPAARIVLATGNPDKVTEMRLALVGLDVEIRTRADYPAVPETVEDGATLEENALKKARELCEATGIAAVADDTGLEADALGGAPGVFSSRFAGPRASYAENVAELLKRMESVQTGARTARFRCVIALVEPGGIEVLVEGICPGEITTERRGQGGFGYDPVFLPEGAQRTFAEMSLEEKDRVSHRGQAMRRLRALLVERFSL
ncbi:MAG: RdgB/HAM1 family non-canonical purine NTP pyrophosphatase [Candidatus Eisenbacteria bacterium]